ncbi:MAG: hypothetical protein ACRDRL_34040, partial [Sciscionella sp.]
PAESRSTPRREHAITPTAPTRRIPLIGARFCLYPLGSRHDPERNPQPEGEARDEFHGIGVDQP